MSDNEQGRAAPTKAAHSAASAQDVSASRDEDRTLVRGAAASPLAGAFVPGPGDLIGEGHRFELLERLGAGGMGVVFRARDHQLDRAVAIKLILPAKELSWEQLVEQLTQEAKANAKLHHENIVALFDIDTWNGAPFLVMELMQGQSLRELLARERLSPLRATALLADVARGLAHAHANGVIHRDLKPSNVFVLPDGRAKILDFGLARSFGERRLLLEGGSILNEDDTALSGTPAYMSPEQWRREPQDGRTDIWALGVLYYEMLVGAVPFSSAELRAFLSPSRPRLVAPSVRAKRADLPEEADRLITRALSPDPADRYQTVGEVLEALSAVDAKLRARSEARPTARPRAEPERRLLSLVCCTLVRPVLSDDEDPEDASETLRAFHQLCAEAIEPFNGTIVTSLSGQLLACFGYPEVDEDDPVRAVRAALGVVRAAQAAEPVVPIRVGVHTAQVVVQPQTGVPALHGEAPGLAAWLSGQADANTVLMSERTAQLVPGLFRTQKHEGFTPLQGKLMAAWEVLAERGVTSRFKVAAHDELSPLVGREPEVGRLLQLWSETRQGRGQWVMLSGDPGLGKSRIAHELLARVGDDAHRMTAQCWPQFRHSPLYPVIDLEYRVLGLKKGGPPATNLERLERELSVLGDPAQYVPLWASLLSIPLQPPYAPLQLAPDQQKSRTLEALVQLLLKTAQKKPTLVVLEDVHWVDFSTLELLNYLYPEVAKARLMMVLTFRPEFRPPWPDARHRHHLELDRLPTELAAAMVRQAASQLPPDLVTQLVTRADGIPLFLEQLTRAVLEAGSPRALDIPDTLHDLLLARLDRLSGQAREAAQLAAVIGREFSFALLRKLWTEDEPSLRTALGQLVDAGLLARKGAPEDDRYAFKHTLIQEVAHQSLLKKRRQQQHDRVTRVLLSDRPDTVEANPELVAHHLVEAGSPDQAIGYLEKAGQRAVQRSAQIDAINHFSKALQLLNSQPESPERSRHEIALRLSLGGPLMMVRGYGHPDVGKVYGRARELCRQLGEDTQLIPALQGLWQFYMVSGDLQTGRELSEQLLALARAKGDTTTLMLAHRALGTNAMLQGELTACLENIEKGLALYDASVHRALGFKLGHDPGVAHGVYAAWSLWILGRPDEALARAQAAVGLARALNHQITICFVHTYLALVHNYRGEFRAAIAAADEAIAISNRHTVALWGSSGHMQAGWAKAVLGDLDAGIREFREGLTGWMATGARAGLTFFPITLAGLYLRARRLEEAATQLEESREMVEQNGERFYEPELYRLEGELLLAREPSNPNAIAEAEKLYRRGLQVARQQRAKAWELRLATSLAQALSATDRAEEGRRVLEEVYGRFDQGFQTMDLVVARKVLGR